MLHRLGIPLRNSYLLRDPVLQGQPIAMANTELSGAALRDYSYTVVDAGTATAGSTITLNYESGQMVHLTAASGFTVAFSNLPTAGWEMTLRLTNGGIGAITWPTTIRWNSGVPPTPVSSGIDTFEFYGDSGASALQGYQSGFDMQAT